MLVTPEKDRQNWRRALGSASMLAVVSGVAGWLCPALWLGLALCPFVYWLARRRCLRRKEVVKRPFPDSWEQTLRSHVRFFEALSDRKKARFRDMVKVFLDEVRITGVRTEVDDTIRVLVAASAVIPVFGFDDWEYHRLRAVLVYPTEFGEDYQTPREPGASILGLAGVEHNAGHVILSKPHLLAGFDNPNVPYQVGVHEFTHVVEDEEAHRGLPPEVPLHVVQRWVEFVARELAHPRANRVYVREYAYTNPREFFAVLAEYFFKSPEVVREKDPKLYQLLRKMFHQDPGALFRRAAGRRRCGRSCPCRRGGGTKPDGALSPNAA
jgi:MtfA peptidase